MSLARDVVGSFAHDQYHSPPAAGRRRHHPGRPRYHPAGPGRGRGQAGLKLAAWCLSASAAAAAGALHAAQVGIINPGLLDPALSLEVAIWVAVGGRGGLVGAVLVSLLKFWLAGAALELCPFVLSLMVLGVVLALPNGPLDARNRSRSWMAGMAAHLPGRQPSRARP